MRVRRLTDRRTGIAIYRYASRDMSGPLPPVLYKYLPLQYATSMIQRGELMFSTLAWFQDIEDRERGDEFEGTQKYFPVGGLRVTRTERDGRSHSPVEFTLPNDSLQSKAKACANIFIYSMSLRPGLVQFSDADKPSTCVEITDPAKFLERLRAVLRRTPRAKVDTLIHDKVHYYSFSDPPGSVHALPDRLTMHKHEAYRGQYEYRVAFGTRRDVFDFEQVDYHVVREGIRRRREVLDESDHRRKLTLGQLTQCCRIA